MDKILNYPAFQAFDSAGDPLVGGKVYTYLGGTLTPKTTYQDAEFTTPNTNPVILDSRGEAKIYGSGIYKIVLKDSNDVTIITMDNITYDESLYAQLPGKAGGQTLYGGTAAGNDLTLRSTSNASKGDVIICDDDGKVGIGTPSPALKVDVTGDLVVRYGTAITDYPLYVKDNAGNNLVTVKKGADAGATYGTLNIPGGDIANVRKIKGGQAGVSYNLEVGAGTTVNRGNIELNKDVGYGLVVYDGNSVEKFSVNKSGDGLILMGANVGIGIAAPDGQLSQGLSNGQQISYKSLTELTTIAAASTTDTSIQIPANVIVKAVSVRVTVAIPTAATFTVTRAAGGGITFNTVAVSTAVDTTNKGNLTCPYNNAAASAIRITPNLTPATNVGRVRVTIWYEDSIPPTS